MSSTSTQVDRKPFIPGLVNEVMFKYVFADPILLGGLINGLLEYEGDQRVTSLMQVPPAPPARRRKHGATQPRGEVVPATYAGRSLALGLLVVDQLGRQFSIEIVSAQRRFIPQRAMVRIASMLDSQGEEALENETLQPCIGIFITDTDVFPGRDKVHTAAGLYDTVNNIRVSDLLEWHLFELGKVKLDSPDDCATEQQKWLHALTHGERYGDGKKALPEALATIRELPLTFTRYRAGLSDRLVSSVAHMSYMDDRTFEHELEDKRAEGKSEGAQEKAREVARKLRELGTEPALIASTTGLAVEEVIAL